MFHSNTSHDFPSFEFASEDVMYLVVYKYHPGHGLYPAGENI